MTISYNWLKQFINLPWDAEKTGELLTNLGLEVEDRPQLRDVTGVDLGGRVVARLRVVHVGMQEVAAVLPKACKVVGDNEIWQSALWTRNS